MKFHLKEKDMELLCMDHPTEDCNIDIEMDNTAEKSTRFIIRQQRKEEKQ
jgi:hypothetical protein